MAIFLDINKAYDTDWIQGLLFKMAKNGIAGSFLGWIKEFLAGGGMSVRIGSTTSFPAPVENGVPQGAVLSPILFNIMLIDFPSPSPETKILLFADDVLLYSMVKRPADA